MWLLVEVSGARRHGWYLRLLCSSFLDMTCLTIFKIRKIPTQKGTTLEPLGMDLRPRRSQLLAARDPAFSAVLTLRLTARRCCRLGREPQVSYGEYYW